MAGLAGYVVQAAARLGLLTLAKKTYSLFQSAQAVVLTGSTSETVLASRVIASGTLLPNDFLLVRIVVSNTNSGGTKAFRMKLGSQLFADIGTTTSSSGVYEWTLEVRSLTMQVGTQTYGGPSFAGGYAGSTPFAINPNLANAQTLEITGQLGSGADTLTLEGFSVELRRP